MVNKVIDGMTEAIYNTFGREHEIYNEPVLQNLAPASFSVRCLDARIDRFLNNKFKRTCLMEVNYFPESTTDPRTEIQGVIDDLFDTLEVIKVSGVKVRGVRADSKIIDNVLVYVLTYVFYTYKVEEVEYMWDLTQQIHAVWKEANVAKTKKVDEEVVEEVEVLEEPASQPEPEQAPAADPVFTREELAASERFKAHKWLVIALIGKDEKVTVKEAQRRIDVFLKRTIEA